MVNVDSVETWYFDNNLISFFYDGKFLIMRGTYFIHIYYTYY